MVESETYIQQIKLENASAWERLSRQVTYLTVSLTKQKNRLQNWKSMEEVAPAARTGYVAYATSLKRVVERDI